MELFIQHSLAHTCISETRYACVHSPRLLGSVLLHCDRPRSTRESLKFMLAFVRPGYSGGSVLPHCDGPRSIRESLHACVHSPRLTLLVGPRSIRESQHTCVHSPRSLGGSVQQHYDGPRSTRESLYACVHPPY